MHDDILKKTSLHNAPYVMEICHPMGTPFGLRVKRHAIHHGCIVYAQKIRGKATTRVHRVMEDW